MFKTHIPIPLEPGRTHSGRPSPILTEAVHHVSGVSLFPPYPEEARSILFGMGCFWGAEKRFWGIDGVYVTAVGYAGGLTPNPIYKEVCSGHTGHAEVVKVVYQPDKVSVQELLKVFWESHDPTQGMRQGNDHGTQYRSAIYLEHGEASEEILEAIHESYDLYSLALAEANRGEITTEWGADQHFYPAETDHQQYLSKNPHGYCGLGGTGVTCPTT